MQTEYPRIMIVVGEASGDLHGANLVTEIKKLMPHASCYGLGGDMMQEAGVDIKAHASELSVVGLVEVIKHYPRLRKILTKMKNLLKNNPPDLLILIDAPDFNFPIAKTAKRNNIKVMYYVSPQIWAWRSSRIKIIKKCVDMMAVVFPFEVEFYKKANVSVEYVGHPLVKDAYNSTSKNEFIANEKLNTNKKLIGIFPGSRKSEIENNFPVLIEAAILLTQQRDDIQFITPIASTIEKEFLLSFVKKNSIHLNITDQNIYDVIHACDAIAAASGTVTLQITLMQTPMLIMYKISPVTYWILKKIVKFSYAGIANVIANKEICREFIQNDATAENISVELNKLLSDSHYVNEMKTAMQTIKHKLGEKDGSAATAKLVANLISNS